MDQATQPHQSVVAQLSAEVRTPPDYLNSDYIQRALAIANNCETLCVESCHIEGINQQGENFCSAIYRVHVSYRKCDSSPLEQQTLILKDLLPELVHLGSNELYMFQKVLPAMESIMATAHQLDDTKLSAKCLFAERAFDKEIYLLEDLNQLGFRMANRFDGLTFDEALVSMHKMAQFHAASMVLLQQNKQLAEKLASSHYATGVDDMLAKIIVLDGISFAADVVAEWPNMQHIARKMRAQLPAACSRRMCDAVNPELAAFNVIVHGDLWLNNLLFNKQTERAILVDFQHCFIGSPAIDLQFFFYTSLQLDVLLDRQTELLKKYSQSLFETLKACHYMAPMPTYQMLLDEMQRCLYYGYYGVVCELGICCASKEVSADFTITTFTEKQTMRKKRQQLYANERVRAALKATLGYFNHQGILEAP